MLTYTKDGSVKISEKDQDSVRTTKSKHFGTSLDDARRFRDLQSWPKGLGVLDKVASNETSWNLGSTLDGPTHCVECGEGR